MKKTIKISTVLLIAVINILCFIQTGSCQATSATPAINGANVPNTAGVDYLGWDNTVGVPLTIQHPTRPRLKPSPCA